MAEIGPVQLISIGFDPGSHFEGTIIDELAKLESERTIRVLDLLFIAKDPDSDETAVLEHPSGADMGEVVSTLLGFELEGNTSPTRSRPASASRPGPRPPRRTRLTPSRQRRCGRTGLSKRASNVLLRRREGTRRRLNPNMPPVGRRSFSVRDCSTSSSGQ